MIEVGSKVVHKLSGSWLTVLEVGTDTQGDEYVTCRTKDFRVVTLYKWEVELVDL